MGHCNEIFLHTQTEAEPQSESKVDSGKPEAFRHVRRQSREPPPLSSFTDFLVTFTLPSMPRVAVIPQPNSPVEIREVPEPQLEDNSALFQVELSGSAARCLFAADACRVFLTRWFRPRRRRPVEQNCGRVHDVEGRELRERSRYVSRCPPHLQCLLALPGGQSDHTLPAAEGLRNNLRA